ncbi:PREDICTED: UDP-glucuronosyltransferase 2B17-like [Diuraphis noxia]|uniref:UDP-glucuronosyltransferase 2B17-like n=1 Tax=Diuraphis noxia TaxID=143948 RepID=UPI0007637448|nr:PREDICTED: UDP-glucuronosyltransferase 2B17-like [Diuraphis noxia]XP_015366575.1 PREDICTED: UDP-glucuronosyltransferase 2B17-like [Diuraphis noxia]XP_015366576.1 PREDICTED: UDP-glucuronosyltransferase 2B17-like [Diuraphis noxia]XP_015366577.1 PREDICTED: UDP-glucuronosyltransferase 2B17-like [Diuraphis noxia]
MTAVAVVEPAGRWAVRLQTAMVAVMVLLLAWTPAACSGARILAVFPYNGHSHFAMVEPLMVALSERGHHVTVISPFPRRKDGGGGRGYVDVDVSDTLPPVISQLNVTEEFEYHVDPVTGLRDLWRMNHRVCETTFEHPLVRALINEPRNFDVVFTEAFATDCFAAFAHAYDAPLVSIRTSDYSPQLNRCVANPQNPAYLVNHLLTYTSRGMSFVQRVVNALATHFGAVGYHAFSDGPSTELVRRHFGPSTPPVPEIARQRTALVLVNAHHSLTQPRPTVPNAVEVGGLHIAQTAELENAVNEWSDYCDLCDQGVIYVSFGSLLKGSSFPLQFTTAFVQAFEALPYCVLWKYEGELMSKRIKVSKWMPQQQILSHRNVKAFITHGGLMGVMEAVHFAVPMIGIPVFGDQQSNVANCVAKGVAIGMDHQQITVEKLIKNILAVVTDSKYKSKVSELSVRFRDRPSSALETAVFWTEYVIRHGNATNTASLAINLDIYQYFLLDVVGVGLSILVFLFYIMFRIKKCIR